MDLINMPEEKHYKELAKDVSGCVFGQQYGFTMGILSGMGMFLMGMPRQRALINMLGFSTLGMGADLYWARSVVCRDLIKSYEETKKRQLQLDKFQEKK